MGAPAGREEFLAGLEVGTDRRIDRYWQLKAIINGWPPFPSYMRGRPLADRWVARSRVTGKRQNAAKAPIPAENSPPGCT